MKTVDKFRVREIPIASLMLDLDNFRTGRQESQLEAIKALIADQGDKLVSMARDLCDQGFSPLDALAIIPSPTSSSIFICVDGNRRIASLKLLHTPDLALGTSVYEAFRSLHKSHAKTAPTSASCVELENREEAMPWIRRRHDRDLGGIGLETWSAMAIGRFQESVAKKKDPALVVVDFVREGSKLTESERESLAKVPITTVRRVINDRYVKDYVGFDFEGGGLIGTRDKAAVAKVLKRIVLDFASKSRKVDHVRSKGDREKYIQQVVKETVGKRPAAGRTWQIGAALPPGEGTRSAKRSRVTRKVHRSTVAPARGHGLVIPDEKAAQIFTELCGLKVEKYLVSSAVALRTFLEVSCIAYQRKHGLDNAAQKQRHEGGHEQQKLHERIDAVADHLESSGAADKNELKGTRVQAKSRHSIIATNTFNAYVHNPHFIPRPGDVTGAWDQLAPFFGKIWA
jgi:hypothetical protein